MKPSAKRKGKARILPEAIRSPRRHRSIDTFAHLELGTGSPQQSTPQPACAIVPAIDSCARTDYTVLIDSSENRMDRPLVIEIVSDVV